MEESREQILEDFQSCTGIEDIEESIAHLENANWNLLNAINSVMPESSQMLPSDREPEFPMDLIEGAMAPPPQNYRDHPEGQPARSIHVVKSDSVDEMQLASRLLNFSVQYKENLVPLEVPDSETVGAIKAALHLELGVPPCKQELLGFAESRPPAVNPITDDTILSTLHLPQRTCLVLSSPDLNHQSPKEDSIKDRFDEMYKLHIVDMANGKDYELRFPGSKTVMEVKRDIGGVTNIPVRFQQWMDWPEAIKDDTTLLAVLENPGETLNLILNKEERVPKSKNRDKKNVVDIASSESDNENEYEDATDCFGVDDDMLHATTYRRVQPLMPDEIDDELAAITHFEHEFENRYGHIHPSFQGTLAEALQASCYRPAKERRPLAIYLHHDASVLANVFCSQMLCSEAVVNYLALNFATWAWDISFDSNKTFLLATLSQHLGMAAANAVRSLELDALPALVIISKCRSVPEVLTVIPGNVILDDLMTRLVHAFEIFNSELQSEILEEEERIARDNVKKEQDAAYAASLEADRAKEEARRQEFEEKMKQEEEELLKKEELEQLRQHEEAIKDAIRKSLAEQLPPEPPSDADGVSEIRVRLPSGEIKNRSFSSGTPLSTLLNFLASEGYPPEEFKVLASWPRVDLTTVDSQKTLEELRLYPKETVTLEER